MPLRTKTTGEKMIEPSKCYVVAEIGINHNGDLDIAKRLIKVAHEAGCDAVKFQKRTIDLVYTEDELSMPRESPFGTTNGDLKRGLEFGKEQYDEIDRYCRELGIEWYAAPWDEESLKFLSQYDMPYVKVASAMVTDADFLKLCAQTGKPLLVSTGMCDMEMIKRIVSTVEKSGGEIACLYHCVSTYPAKIEDLNLNGIISLQKAFPEIPIGYSGHEPGVPPSVMAAVIGAASVERHITLSRAMWGSDQAASLEPQGVIRLVRDIRTWENARGNGEIKILESERPIEKKLRRKNTI